MAIDKASWVKNFKDFKDYFPPESRDFELNATTERMWYQLLSARLTTEEFEQAVQLAVFSCTSMPSPKKLIELLSESKIYDQWIEIDKARKRVPTYPNAQAEYQALVASMQLDPVASKALEVLGGLSALSKMDEEAIAFRRQEFVKVYLAYKPREQELQREALESQLQLAEAQRPLAALPEGSAPEVNIPLSFPETQERIAETLQTMSANIGKPMGTPKKTLSREEIEAANDRNRAWLRKWGHLRNTSEPRRIEQVPEMQLIQEQAEVLKVEQSPEEFDF
jgi:hypothetical protein